MIRCEVEFLSVTNLHHPHIMSNTTEDQEFDLDHELEYADDLDGGDNQEPPADFMVAFESQGGDKRKQAASTSTDNGEEPRKRRRGSQKKRQSNKQPVVMAIEEDDDEGEGRSEAERMYLTHHTGLPEHSGHRRRDRGIRTKCTPGDPAAVRTTCRGMHTLQRNDEVRV